jgi:hypothetical protein
VQGHAQQNGEQLNNVLKTLHGYYFRNGNTTDDQIFLNISNKSEFISYFVLFQLGNGGEVSKYLQKLPSDILDSEEIKFALQVWCAIRTENYIKVLIIIISID